MVHKGVQTAGPNYPFNWTGLTGGGEGITLTKLKRFRANTDTMGINVGVGDKCFSSRDRLNCQNPGRTLMLLMLKKEEDEKQFF